MTDPETTGSTPPAGSGEGRDRGRIQFLVGLAIIALLAAGVVLTGIRFGQGRRNATTPAIAGPDIGEGVVLQVILVSLDPIKSEMTLRLIPIPVGSYGRLGFERPVNILTATSTGLTETEIKVGSPVTSYEVTTSLLDSQVAEYPFDSYDAPFEVLVATPVEEAPAGAPGGGSDPEPSVASRTRAVPTQIRVEGVLHGYKIVTRPQVQQTDEFGGEVSLVTAFFEVSRSGSTRFFAIFVMALMWAISIGVLWIALSVVFRRRRIEPAILSMFGIVLFALPNVRNAQPNAPPIGSLTDVLAFFWCESIVAAALVAMIIVFVRRSPDAPLVGVRGE